MSTGDPGQKPEPSHIDVAKWAFRRMIERGWAQSPRGPASVQGPRLPGRLVEAVQGGARRVDRQETRRADKARLYQGRGDMTRRSKKKLVREQHAALGQVLTQLRAELMSLCCDGFYPKSSRDGKLISAFLKHVENFRSDMDDITAFSELELDLVELNALYYGHEARSRIRAIQESVD